jgi:hypothetical protein
MAKLEDLRPNAAIRGILPDALVTVVNFRLRRSTRPCCRASHHVHYIRRPFQREPDFGVTSVNYSFAELLARAEEPG